MMKRIGSPFAVAVALAAQLAPIGQAQACAIVVELRPQVAASAPVVFRGRVESIVPDSDGGTELGFEVTETLRGTPAAHWTVAWSPDIIIGAPEDLDAFQARYGDDVVVGLIPDEEAEGAGSLVREYCGAPFLDAYAALEPLLRENGIAE